MRYQHQFESPAEKRARIRKELWRDLKILIPITVIAIAVIIWVAVCVYTNGLAE